LADVIFHEGAEQLNCNVEYHCLPTNAAKCKTLPGNTSRCKLQRPLMKHTCHEGGCERCQATSSPQQAHGGWTYLQPAAASQHGTQPWQVDNLDITNSPVLSHTKPSMGEAPSISIPQDSKPSTAPYRRNR